MAEEAAEKKKGKKKKKKDAASGNAKYPRHTVERALRIPAAIIDQNAGKECTDRDAAKYVGVGFNGPFRVEISSAIKYGFLNRPKPGSVGVTELARQALRPQKDGDRVAALRQAILAAPDVGEVYSHYRGENLPDGEFFINALTDKFGVPQEKTAEFAEIFLNSLESAQLTEHRDQKIRILDVTATSGGDAALSPRTEKLGAGIKIAATDSCFVVMPFAPPIGNYYSLIYEPAIQKAGLKPVRADNEIFGTGKIMDQIWSGINAARVLVAELTSRNANVFYELGLAHALKKPVVLVSSNEGDVPFDLQHIRVIYYDVADPFWGNKLIEKVSENILSALKNPDEAIFQRAL